MGGSVRDSLKAYSPKWLQGAIGEKFLYVFGLGCDVVLEKLNQAMRMHIPTYGDPSGLATIGADRLIPQGPNETPSAYAQRLKLAYDDWQLAGSARAIMRQIRAYLTPVSVMMRVVGQGVAGGSFTPWDTYIAGASTNNPPAHYNQSPQNWNWDASGWPSTFLIIDCSSGSPFAAENVWGTGTWGDGGTWGSTATVSQVNAMQSICALWKDAGPALRTIILNFNAAGSVFDPAVVGNGTGFYGRNHRFDNSQNAVPVRPTGCAYLDGAP